MSEGRAEGAPEPTAPTGWRGVLHEVIFEADTRAGKAFDVALLLCIVASVVTVLLESVAGLVDLMAVVPTYLSVFVAGAQSRSVLSACCASSASSSSLTSWARPGCCRPRSTPACARSPSSSAPSSRSC